MIDVVVIPAAPTSPARVERLPAWDLAGFQRLVGGYTDAIPVGDELCLLARRGAALRGFPVNQRAGLLALYADPAFDGVDLRGDIVAAGPPDGDDLTPAPAWLRDLYDPAARFHVVDLTPGPEDDTEPLPFPFTDPFLGLAALAGMTRAFPESQFRLTRITNPEDRP
ncbi:hypothetical protein I6A60_40730 [Frankia sp. AgB1.9]|uniref:DUF3846 domain-containing protein n=1 Tax=unclassified Frankia TaxID=2632575 RepID=UPI001932916C|nr:MULTISPECIES: hypothetical protein [unclassified Frankia]MBL7489049.1 hypothetical protein [Frankia sp. AgW1.1]MBL7554105.1 hypothetical protein [Frankia sp. AgB1.9]MBL7618489.1 hypothetical protein [Frankia sp. AgB1.8]